MGKITGSTARNAPNQRRRKWTGSGSPYGYRRGG